MEGFTFLVWNWQWVCFVCFDLCGVLLSFGFGLIGDEIRAGCLVLGSG